MARTALFRSEVIDRLKELLDAAGIARTDGSDSVQVLHHEPATMNLEDEVVWFGETTGDVSVPFMVAGRKVLDDSFTVEVWFAVANPGNEGHEARVRAERLASGVADFLQDDPAIDDLDGILWCTPTGTYRLLAPVAREDGEGFGCAGQLTVSVKARIQ